MTKQITEYYCDMCGKKVPWIMNFRLPYMTNRTVYDECNETFRKEIDEIVPEEVDLCMNCTALIYSHIKTIKHVIKGE